MLRAAKGVYSVGPVMAIVGVWMMYIATDSSSAPNFLEAEPPQHSIEVNTEDSQFSALETLKMISLTELNDSQVHNLQHQAALLSRRDPDVSIAGDQARRMSSVPQSAKQEKTNAPEFVRLTSHSQEQQYNPMSDLVASVPRALSSGTRIKTEMVEIKHRSEPQTASIEQVTPIVASLENPSVDDVMITIQWPQSLQQQLQFYQKSQQCGLIRSVVIPGGRRMDQHALISATEPNRKVGESLLVRELPDFVRENMVRAESGLNASSQDMVVLFFKQSLDRQLRRIIEASRQNSDYPVRGFYETHRSGLYLALVETGRGKRTIHQLTACTG